MKNLILFIAVLLIGLTRTVAQEADSLSAPNLAAEVDNLKERVAKLQHDFNYLDCCYQIDQVRFKLDIARNSIGIEARALQLVDYHSSFDAEYYEACRANYEAYKASFDAQKDYAQHLKTLLSLKMVLYNFTEQELDVLEQALKAVDSSIKVVEKSLDLYKLTLRQYLL